MKRTAKESRRRIHNRIRRKVEGTSERPRLCVYRSSKSIYCQVIDDVKGVTLAAANSRESSIPAKLTKSEQATAVGKLVAEKATLVGIKSVVFDRGGYLYHGRIKSLADGARDGGLQF
jgi:large subunit ribosomal protein L18